jgi:predicted nucleic acid-binding protein
MISSARGLVLDANILVRAVFGKQVIRIVHRFERASLYAPDRAFEDARIHIPRICQRRRWDPLSFLGGLNDVADRVASVNRDEYADYEHEARARIQSRDPNDWPIVALSLALDLPIWTEDRDFFGCGIATWITRTVEIYLRQGESA